MDGDIRALKRRTTIFIWSGFGISILILVAHACSDSKYFPVALLASPQLDALHDAILLLMIAIQVLLLATTRRLLIRHQELGQFLLDARNAAENEGAKMASLLEAIGDPVSIREKDLRIVYQNAAQRELWGDHLGDFCYSAYCGRSSSADGCCPSALAMGDGKVHRCERGVVLDSGTKYLHLTASPLRDASGEIWGAIEISRDISIMKSNEQEIRQLNDELRAVNRELEAFNYSLSHDLRNPLMGIIGSCQELLGSRVEYGLGSETCKLLEAVLTCGNRIEELIAAMLDLAKVAGGEMAADEVDLSTLVEEVALELQLARQRLMPHFSVEPGLTVRGDRNLLRIALTNLLDNAWKFSASVDRPVIEVGSTMRCGELIYFVRDNGVGFNPGRSVELFQPFKRLHAYSDFPGTGIGLATVQRVVRRHGGRIWAESSIGRGATFYFTLSSAS